MKTNLNDLFDQLEPEKGNELDKKIKVEKSKEVEEILDKLYNIEDKYTYRSFHSIDSNFLSSNQVHYSSNHLTNFSLSLTDKIIDETIQDVVGFYLNNLIRMSSDQNHTVFTRHLKNRLNQLGYKCEKHITIDGDAGHFVGDKLDGGNIVINGSAKDYLGRSMRKGKIIVKGNSGLNTGDSMVGGIIEIQGEIRSIASIIHKGDIYHKNKQIVKDGKILDTAYLK